ncbi:MAG: multicopper oxidase [Solibacillus sp.]
MKFNKHPIIPDSNINPSDPNTIPKFVDALKKPPTAVARPKKDYPIGSYYEINMIKAKHQFHKSFPYTEVWGYNGMIPGPTIEAKKDVTTYVKFLNKLPNKHFLPIDYSLHGVNNSPEVRTVVHLHGANVATASDGHPEAWYTRDFAVTGPMFTREVHAYTNHQPGTTMWYHDHTMGLTRLNVVAGLAGFYLLRDVSEERLKLPKGDYEIPLLIQDRSFNEDGSIFYPTELGPPFPLPVPDPLPLPNPTITLGYVGNTIVVNGKLWPFLEVEPRKYRFRILNGSNRRSYSLRLSNDEVLYQIGTDGGFLAATTEINTVDLSPAERIDVIIDFTNFANQEVLLMNDDEEFADEHTNVIMKFKVTLPLKEKDTSEIPTLLEPSMDMHEHHAHTIRDLPLTTTLDRYGRIMLLLGDRMYHDPATEKPSLDSIEVWNFINTTPGYHPIHLHLVQFKIIERRPFNVELYINEGIIEFTGEPEEPREYERGWKDTVKADGGKVTKIMMHWKEHTGDYMWHCHFLEHEDHDMMRPIRVINDAHPVQPPHIDDH